MTGLEILAFMLCCFVVAATAMASRVTLEERRKRLFLNSVATTLQIPMDVESGDVGKPLSFTLDNVRVCALLRGEVEVWQLERLDHRIDCSSVALIHCDWHAAAEVRALPTVAALTPRLSLRATDAGAASGLLSRARAELASLLGRHTRQCVIGPGRAFLEVTRRGLDLDELRDALARLEGVVQVAKGRHAFLPAASAEHAIAGPAGVPIPGVG